MENTKAACPVSKRLYDGQELLSGMWGEALQSCNGPQGEGERECKAR
jgi:hypothetical protein